MAINVNELTKYVDENRDAIIKTILYAAPSVKHFNVMSNVKSDTALNLLNTTISFGDGKTCGWSDNGSATLSQRVMKPVALKVNMSYCQRALIDYWTNIESNIKAGVETLPQEEAFVNDLVTNVNKAVDKMIWYGDSSDASTVAFDGVVTILSASDVSTSVVKVNPTSALDASLYSKLGAVIKAIPSEVYQENEVFMSVDTFRGVVDDFESSHPYKSLNFTDDEKLTFIYPNTNIPVHGIEGMQTTDADHKKDMVSFNPKMMFYGTDHEDATSSFKFIFDDREQEFDLIMLMNGGVQVAWPDQCVLALTYTV